MRNSACFCMNKQKNRYTPFSGKYKMPVDEFCMKYGLDLKIVMHRMNVLYWEDFDSLVIPQNVGDTSADKIRRTLMCLNQGWDFQSTARRMSIPVKSVEAIAKMDEYRQKMFLNMDNYFFLDPKKVNLDMIFTEQDEEE